MKKVGEPNIKSMIRSLLFWIGIVIVVISILFLVWESFYIARIATADQGLGAGFLVWGFYALVAHLFYILGGLMAMWNIKYNWKKNRSYRIIGWLLIGLLVARIIYGFISY